MRKFKYGIMILIMVISAACAVMSCINAFFSDAEYTIVLTWWASGLGEASSTTEQLLDSIDIFVNSQIVIFVFSLIILVITAILFILALKCDRADDVKRHRIEDLETKHNGQRQR